MPRVSEAHLEARRRHILDAARRCFARNGIHPTSMQDVIREAGVSVGAFYRYFKSKDELIRAIAEEVVGGVAGALDRLLGVDPLPPLPDVLGNVLRVVEPHAEPDGALRMAIQVWGEALRDPGLKAMVAGKYGHLRSRFVRLAERARADGQLPADCEPETVGAALFSLMVGYFLQVIMVGGIDREAYERALAALLGTGVRAG
jgi:AcrR family transcriptional regulator